MSNVIQHPRLLRAQFLKAERYITELGWIAKDLLEFSTEAIDLVSCTRCSDGKVLNAYECFQEVIDALVEVQTRLANKHASQSDLHKLLNNITLR